MDFRHCDEAMVNVYFSRPVNSVDLLHAGPADDPARLQVQLTCVAAQRVCGNGGTFFVQFYPRIKRGWFRLFSFPRDCTFCRDAVQVAL